MYQIDTADSVNPKPAYAGAGVPGWFQDTAPGGGTTVPQDWMNHVQAEFKTIIEAAGLALSKADDTLLWQAVGGGAAVKSHGADTGVVSTPHDRAVIASETSRANTQDAVVMACDSCIATSTQTAVIASGILAGASPTAGAARTAVIASGGAVITAGAGSVVIASDGSAAVGAGIAATGSRSAVIASYGMPGPPATPSVASGPSSAVLASEGCEAAGGLGTSAVIASTLSTAGQAGTRDSAVIASASSSAKGSTSAAVASVASDAPGTAAAVIASMYSALADGTAAAVVASDGARAQGTNAAAVACHDGNASGTQAAVIASDSVTVSGTNAAAVAVGTGSTVAGRRSAVIASVTSSITGDPNTKQAVIAGAEDSTIQKVDAADTPGELGIVAAHDCLISGNHAQSGIFASYETRITKGVGAGVGSNVAQGAAVGCGDCVISSPAAGGNITKAVLLGSKSVELSDGVAGAPNRSYCVAGGYAAGALVPAGAGQNITWRLDSVAGNLFLLGAVFPGGGGGGPDFAEMFENAVLGEIPPGSILARTGRKVRVAKPGDRIFGVVSTSPAILAGACVDAWAGKTVHDEWGRPVVAVDANGVTSPVIAQSFDPGKPYVPRTVRPAEWTPVALVGQVRVRVDEKVVVDGFVTVGPDGVGTQSPTETRIECAEIVLPFNASRGFGVALCVIR